MNFLVNLLINWPERVAGYFAWLGPLVACAVIRRRFSSGCKPHPATAPAGSTGAVMEVTKWLKPSVKRVTKYGDSASVQAAT